MEPSNRFIAETPAGEGRDVRQRQRPQLEDVQRRPIPWERYEA